MTGPRNTSERPKRRVHVLDSVAVRGVVWLALAFMLVAPIAVTSVIAPRPEREATLSAAPVDRTVSPTSAPTLSSVPSVPASPVPGNAIPQTPTAGVRDRLAAVLSAYQSRDDFGTPESGAQAAGALHWCAQQLAGYEHISISEASSALSAALIEPSSAAGLRVVSAIEAPSRGADDQLRMHCASLLYAQLQR